MGSLFAGHGVFDGIFKRLQSCLHLAGAIRSVERDEYEAAFCQQIADAKAIAELARKSKRRLDQFKCPREFAGVRRLVDVGNEYR